MPTDGVESVEPPPSPEPVELDVVLPSDGAVESGEVVVSPASEQPEITDTTMPTMAIVRLMPAAG